MKYPGSCRPRRSIGIIAVLFFMILLLGVFSISTALGASGEGGGKGWVATDTYRVMNFAVLAIALFFVLRKPLSQALNSRIKVIKDELEDLEARKVEAEKKNWPNTTKNWLSWKKKVPVLSKITSNRAMTPEKEF